MRKLEVKAIPRWRRPARFLVFGSINTLVTYGFYLLLLQVLPYAVAYSISYVAGIFTSYAMNARFVFHQKLHLGTALRYPAIYVVQYLLGISMLFVLVEIFHMSEALAPFLVAILLIPAAYLLSRHVITRPGRRQIDPGHAA